MLVKHIVAWNDCGRLVLGILLVLVGGNKAVDEGGALGGGQGWLGGYVLGQVDGGGVPLLRSLVPDL